MLRKLLLLTFIVFWGIGFFKYADAHVTLNLMKVNLNHMISMM